MHRHIMQAYVQTDLGSHTGPDEELDAILIVHEHMGILLSPKEALSQIQSLSIDLHSINGCLGEMPP